MSLAAWMRGVLLLSIAACAPSPIRIDLPASDDRALILILELDGEEPRIEAIDPLNALALPNYAEYDGRPLRLTLLGYSSALAELKLSPGAQTLDTQGRNLPPPARIETLEIRGGEAGRWEKQAAFSGSISSLKIAAPPSPCAKFEVDLPRLSTPWFSNFSVALDERRALIGLYEHLEVDPPATRFALALWDGERPALLPANPTGQGIFSGTLGGDGRIWLSGSGLWTGAIEGGTLRLEPAGPPGQLLEIYRLESSSPGALFELYGLAFPNRLVHAGADGRVTNIHLFTDGDPRGNAGGVEWIGPGEVWAARASAHLVHVKDGAVTVETPPGASAQNGVSAVKYVPGMGLIVALRDGDIYLREGDDYRLVATAGAAPLAIRPYEDGFVYSGEAGLFGQYIRGEHCTHPRYAAENEENLVRLGDDVLMVGTRPIGADYLPMVYLRRQR